MTTALRIPTRGAQVICAVGNHDYEGMVLATFHDTVLVQFSRNRPCDPGVTRHCEPMAWTWVSLSLVTVLT